MSNFVNCFVLTTSYAGDLAISLNADAFKRFLSEPHYSIREMTVPIVDGKPTVYRVKTRNLIGSMGMVRLTDEYGTYSHPVEFTSRFEDYDPRYCGSWDEDDDDCVTVSVVVVR